MRAVPFVVFAVVVVGCNGDEPPADVIYESGGTDEAWITLSEATPIADDALAPRLTSPMSPASRAGIVFTWEGGTVSADAGVARRRARFARSSDDAGTRVARALARLLDPVPRARAHLPPVEGPLYRVEIRDDAGGVLRVLTGATSYTPAADRFAALASPITVDITGAFFTTGRITEGPYRRASPARIELTP